MLTAYIVPRPLARTLVMVVGFGAIVAWMGLAFYYGDGLGLHSGRYLEGRVTSLGEDSDAEAEAEALTPGEALIARLKASMAESDSAGDAGERNWSRWGKRKRALPALQNAFEQDRTRQGTSGQEWRGNGSQLLTWHYERSLGRYFRDQDVLGPMVARMKWAGTVLFGGIVLVMTLLLVMGAKTAAVP